MSPLAETWDLLTWALALRRTVGNAGTWVEEIWASGGLATVTTAGDFWTTLDLVRDPGTGAAAEDSHVSVGTEGEVCDEIGADETGVAVELTIMEGEVDWFAERSPDTSFGALETASEATVHVVFGSLFKEPSAPELVVGKDEDNGATLRPVLGSDGIVGLRAEVATERLETDDFNTSDDFDCEETRACFFKVDFTLWPWLRLEFDLREGIAASPLRKDEETNWWLVSELSREAVKVEEDELVFEAVALTITSGQPSAKHLVVDKGKRLNWQSNTVGSDYNPIEYGQLRWLIQLDNFLCKSIIPDKNESEQEGKISQSKKIDSIKKHEKGNRQTNGNGTLEDDWLKAKDFIQFDDLEMSILWRSYYVRLSL